MNALDLGAHAGFIIASYAIFVLVVAGLIVWIWFDGIAQKRALAALEARGIRRRSDVTTSEPVAKIEPGDVRGVR